MSGYSSTRNPDGIFVNTQMFREPALHYKKYGRYCDYPVGSYEWHKHAEREYIRLTQGLNVGGVHITGKHYYYMNYCPIKRTKEFEEKRRGPEKNITMNRRRATAGKVRDFPDFWDGDYNYYHGLDIARMGCSVQKYRDLKLELKVHSKMIKTGWIGGGRHFLVGKARRKGFSFKNGALATHAYHTVPESLSVIGAYETKYLYPEGTMGMANFYLEFQNEKAPHLFKQRLINRVDHKQAGYEVMVNGSPVKKGYRSQVMAITFMNNADAARGKDAYYFLMEEAGKWPNLENSLNAILPTTTDGAYMVGQIVVFGTGGDMEKGTKDFASMFYSPEAYNFMPFVNIWDEDADDTTCSYFFPNRLNNPGYIDENGNSDVQSALDAELEERSRILKSSKGTYAYNKRIQEYAESPSEAFLTVSYNGLPVKEYRKRLHQLLYDDAKNYKVVELSMHPETKEVTAKVDLKNKLHPIIQFPHNQDDIAGAVMIYEDPIEKAPEGTYLIGMDPYNQDQSEGPSLGAILVYKTVKAFGKNMRQVVAEYVGRPETSDDFYKVGLMLSKLYNDAVIMHENMYRDTRMYYKHELEYWRLAPQPDLLINTMIKNSKVNRPKGIHMTDEIKDAGLKAINKWSLSVVDFNEDGSPIHVWERINSIGLLQELCRFDKENNYDRVMALMMCLFMEDELQLQTVQETKQETSRIEQIRNLRKKREQQHSLKTSRYGNAFQRAQDYPRKVR